MIITTCNTVTPRYLQHLLLESREPATGPRRASWHPEDSKVAGGPKPTMLGKIRAS